MTEEEANDDAAAAEMTRKRMNNCWGRERGWRKRSGASTAAELRSWRAAALQKENEE